MPLDRTTRNKRVSISTDKLDEVRVMIAAGSPAKAAFEYLIAHAKAAAFRLIPRISEVRAVEFQLPDRKLNPYSVQAHGTHLNFYLRRPALNAHPGLFEAAVAQFGPVKANALGEYRKHLHDVNEVDGMLAFLRRVGAWPSKPTDRRFVADTFLPVTGEHFLRAAERLRAGFRRHRFGRSTDYDLLFDGLRLPPKAVFGLAASEALGFEVRPENFSAGESMTCFRMLRANGYQIVPKDDRTESMNPFTDDERSWAEGNPRLFTHLRRERATGLAAAKRANFRANHGYLFCERCGIDPVEAFGSELGEACIEVHHRATSVGAMETGHRTQLDDLQCLCANCHRFVHRALKELQDD